MAPPTHQLAQLSAHGAVIVRAPDSVLVSALPGEPWFADDAAPENTLVHPVVTRWLESLIVAPTVCVRDLDLDDRLQVLFAALDAHALADATTHAG